MPQPGYGPSGAWTPAGSPEDWTTQRPPVSKRLVVPPVVFLRAVGWMGVPSPFFPTAFREQESLRVKEA